MNYHPIELERASQLKHAAQRDINNEIMPNKTCPLIPALYAYVSPVWCWHMTARNTGICGRCHLTASADPRNTDPAASAHWHKQSPISAQHRTCDHWAYNTSIVKQMPHWMATLLLAYQHRIRRLEIFRIFHAQLNDHMFDLLSLFTLESSDGDNLNHSLRHATIKISVATCLRM